MGLVVPGPQAHLNMVAPTSVFAKAVVASLYGTSCMVFPAASLRSGALAELRVVTVITPLLSVVTFTTYFVGALASAAPEVSPASHPQALAAGSTVLAVDWTVSVMEVRHADAAKITSETLARTV